MIAFVASAAKPARFRPLSLPELLDELFRLYRRHFQVIAGVSLLLVIPSVVFSLLSGSYRANPLGAIAQGGSESALGALQQAEANVNPGWSFLGGLVSLVLVSFTMGALYRAGADVMLGRPTSIRAVLSGTFTRYWALWGLAALIVLALSAAVVVVLVPLGLIGLAGGHAYVLVVLAFLVLPFAGIWIGVRWALAIPALLVEGIGPAKALGRSWKLVAGFWWRTFGIILLTIILELAVFLALLPLFGGIAALIPGVSDDVRLTFSSAATTLVDALVGPIFALVLTLLYFDLRVRKEGFDLEQLAQQTSPGTPPT